MIQNSKGFTLIELISILTILSIIGLIATILVVGVIKNIKQDADRIDINNYANSIEYAVELYIKNNNEVPIFCTINDNMIFYDENYNNEYDNNELVCNVDCESDECIKEFITFDNVKGNNKDIKCEKIMVNKDGSVEVSQCSVNNREIKNYSYKVNIQISDDVQMNSIDE